MNKDWANLNKMVQVYLNKASSFPEAIQNLLSLRNILFETVRSFFSCLTEEEFSEMPYFYSDGYHNKTIAYSIWHIFRIEDIVVNSVIRNGKQVFFTGGYQNRINSEIITTGNELSKDQIASFSHGLNLDALLTYASEVKKNTDIFLSELSYQDLKTKIPPERTTSLKSLKVVSEDPAANWLIAYWCGKDIKGLIKMPLSRHWIMHIEAAVRIMHKLRK